jgi:hypothetical protein
MSQSASPDPTPRLTSLLLALDEPSRGELMADLVMSLDQRDAVFETAIRGGSMWPVLPIGTRIRVSLSTGAAVEGKIVFCATNRGFVVHRAVFVPRCIRAGQYMITMGDNCLSPDRPVERTRMLGVVVARETVNGWLPVESLPRQAFVRRAVRFLTLQAVKAALSISAAPASQLAAFLSRLESLLRASVGAVQRSLRSTRSRGNL